jgi:hypothetical protein
MVAIFLTEGRGRSISLAMNLETPRPLGLRRLVEAALTTEVIE